MQTLVDDERREVIPIYWAENKYTNQIFYSQLVFLYKLIDGAASGSFGTHVANLAGVPIEVVERADIISRDFAKNFKDKIEGKKSKATGRLPLTAQADFAYLYNLATGNIALHENEVRKREVLGVMKHSVQSYLPPL